MKAWEFLLQREGDHTWLPLETPTVEILEGRYRIVVRTPCPNETVDIYICYVSTQDDPPKRRVQQRSRQTNADGLMAFLPFTSFRTGRWELRCRPHVEPGSFEQRWPTSLELQVLEQEAATTDDLFGWDLANADSVESHQVQASDDVAPTVASNEATANDPLPASPTALDPHADIQQLAEQMSRMVVDSVLSAADTLPPAAPVTDSAAPTPVTASTPVTDLTSDTSGEIITPESLATDLGSAEERTPTSTEVTGTEVTDTEVTTENPAPSITALPNESTSDTSVADIAALNTAAPPPEIRQTDEVQIASPNVSIYLQQEALTMGGDRQITLSGELQPSLTASPDRDLDTAALPALILTVELRDPGTTEVWESQQTTFPPQAISAIPFSLALTVPTRCPSPLLLGTATLWEKSSQGVAGQGGEEISGSPGMHALSSAVFTVMASVETLLNRVTPPEATEPSTPDTTVQTLQHKAASNFVVTKMGMEPTSARGNRQVNTDLLGLLGSPNAPEAEDGQTSQRGFRTVAKQQLPPKLEPRSPEPKSQGSSLDLPSFGQSRNPVFQWTPPDDDTPDMAQASPKDAQDNPTAVGEDAPPPAPDTNVIEVASDAAIEAPLQTPDEFAIPEEATLEELAELFGTPAPDLGMPDVPTLAATATPTVETAQATEDALGTADQAGAQPSEDQSTEPQSLLEDPLGSATAWVAPSQPDEGERHDAATDSREVHPSELAASSRTASPTDPLMNRMHELVVPQPSAPKESPALLTEIVVEDEDLPATRMAWMEPLPEASTTTDVAIETPEMQIPEGDLVVGETIRIVLRVPTEPPQLCARVWLLDCQSRTLLTEPQWVAAFLPLSDEQVEASIELKIPEGSIELQVEAIAVDPNSQRESRKAAIRRTVVIADASDKPAEQDRFNPWMK